MGKKASDEERVTKITAKTEEAAPKVKKSKEGKKVSDKKAKKMAKKTAKVKGEKREVPKFWRIVRAPFYYTIWRVLKPIGRYLRDSWRELRQVRWTNRKTTWKLTLAVIIYTVIFFLFILLLDMLFSWLFNKVLG